MTWNVIVCATLPINVYALRTQTISSMNVFGFFLALAATMTHARCPSIESTKCYYQTHNSEKILFENNVRWALACTCTAAYSVIQWAILWIATDWRICFCRPSPFVVCTLDVQNDLIFDKHISFMYYGTNHRLTCTEWYMLNTLVRN